jgi:hypothetical protein
MATTKAQQQAPAPAEGAGAPSGPMETTSSAGLSRFANGVALGLLVVYLIFLVAQWRTTGLAEPGWSRRLHLFSGLEALAFAAAGAILGTTVQRQVTKKAEDQAAQAAKEASAQRTRADENHAVAEQGRAVVDLARTKLKRATTGPQARGAAPAQPGDTVDVLTELLEFAENHRPAGSP